MISEACAGERSVFSSGSSRRAQDIFSQGSVHPAQILHVDVGGLAFDALDDRGAQAPDHRKLLELGFRPASSSTLDRSTLSVAPRQPWRRSYSRSPVRSATVAAASGANRWW